MSLKLNQRFRTRKNVLVLGLLLALFVFIIPFLLLCFYTYPGPEDYAESYRLLKFGFLTYLKYQYLTFDGRYFEMLIYAINPLVFGSISGYKLLPFFFFTLLLAAIFFNLKSIRKTNNKSLNNIGYSGIILVVYMYSLEDVCYAFYYMVSSVVYILPVILSLFLIGLLNRLVNTTIPARKLALTIASSVLTFAIVGSNELFYLIIPFILLMFFLNEKNKRIRKELLTLGAICAIGMYLGLSSPALYKYLPSLSSEHSFNSTIFWAVKQSVLTSISTISTMFFRNYTLILITIFYLLVGSFFARPNAKAARHNRNYIVSYALFFLITSMLLATPYYFSVGYMSNDAPVRLFNIINIFFTTGWLFFLEISAPYFHNTQNILTVSARSKLRASLLILIPGSFFLCPNFLVAVDDISSGNASAYKNVMDERIDAFSSHTRVQDFNVPVVVFHKYPLTSYHQLPMSQSVCDYSYSSHLKYFKILNDQEISIK